MRNILKKFSFSFAALVAFLGSESAFADSKSYMLDVGGVATALIKGQEVIGKLENMDPGPALVPKNAFQKQLVTLSADYARELVAHLTGEELTVVASADEKEINDLLEKAGSRIRITFGPDDKFAVVSILSVGIKFVKPGDIATKDEKTQKVTYFDIGGKPAMRFTNGSHAIAMREMKGSREPVIVLESQNGDMLVLHRTDDRHDSGPAAKEGFAQNLLACAQDCPDMKGYLGAIVPLTLVDTDVNLDDLKDLAFEGTDWYVSQAKQQVRFYLDPNGATVKTETVLVFGQRSVSTKPTYYRLDGGYFAVMYRPGMTMPYFSGWVSPEDFNVPPTYTLPEGWVAASAK